MHENPSPLRPAADRAPAPRFRADEQSSGQTRTRLESLVLVHTSSLVIFAAWAFGGNTESARFALSCWGSLGLFITAFALRRRGRGDEDQRLATFSLWPLVLFDLLVLASALHPSYRELSDGVNILYVQDKVRPPDWLPSTARPLLSLQALWFFNVAYLSCFNLVLVVRRRRALRAAFYVVTANAFVLSIFGTLQKLLGAKALFFDTVPSPQPYFFASFIYHNHWGAFAILMTAASLGLVFYSIRQRSRDIWHSPGFAGLVGVALLATTIPLSTSRSSTILETLLLLGAFLYWAISFVRRRRSIGRPFVLPLAGLLAALVTAGGFAYGLARPTVDARLAKTRAQLADMRVRGETIPRQVLYRDTWNLAREKLWFGWGMASFPTAFYHHNTQHDSTDGPVQLFHDAHSDWLQSVAEVGLIGTALLGLCAVVPLRLARRRIAQSPLAWWLLCGCGLIVLYALLEFPFGNRAVVITFWFCFFGAIGYARLDSPAERPI